VLVDRIGGDLQPGADASGVQRPIEPAPHAHVVGLFEPEIDRLETLAVEIVEPVERIFG
jgi:hypothetical protein